MESSAAPDRMAVREQAGHAMKALEPWVKQFNEHSYASEEVAGVLKQLVISGATRKAESWDEAAQTYLAVVAVYMAGRETPGTPSRLPDLRDLLQQIRSNLLFPPDASGPPVSYTPDTLLQPYGLLQRRLRF
jgi:hypothetical protein